MFNNSDAGSKDDEVVKFYPLRLKKSPILIMNLNIYVSRFVARVCFFF